MDNEELMARIESRFDAVDRRFEAIDGRFDALTERMEQRFEQVDRRFEQVDRHFERVDRRLGNLETGLLQADLKTENLQDNVKQLAETVMHVDSKVDRFQEELLREAREWKSFSRLPDSFVEDRLNIHDQKISNLDARVTTLEKDRNA